MKKITFMAKSLFLAAVLFGASTVQAQVELKILTEMGSRFNDVNDAGVGVTVYDFTILTQTPLPQSRKMG